MAAMRHFFLGLFFLAVILILGGYTLFLTDFSLFSEKIRRTIHFSNTSGLREGDPVHVAGMRWGKIEALTYDPAAPFEKRIRVEISLNQPITLYEDSEIVIQDATVLGGKVLAIEPGSPATRSLAATAAWSGVAQPNVLDALGETVNELREPLRKAAEDIQVLVADAKNGSGVLHQLVYDEELARDISLAADRIATTFENAQKLSQDALDGKGTVGKLFTDDTLYNDIQSLAQKADLFLSDGQSLIRDAREGNGLLPKLLSDSAMADDGRKILENARLLTDGLQAGEGTLGRLFKDSQIADNLERLTNQLANGEGTLGKLMQDQSLYDNVLQISEDIKVVSANLRDGRGTMGKLLNDDEIYVELQRAVRTLSGTLEEAREAAPITTLLNTLFLGF